MDLPWVDRGAMVKMDCERLPPYVPKIAARFEH